MDYRKELKKFYLEKQAECGLKVGDTVKVTRMVEDFSGGWDDSWTGASGITDKIVIIGKLGIKLSNGINYPFFVLEKVEPKTRYMTRDEVMAFIIDNPKILIKCNIDEWEMPQWKSLTDDAEVKDYLYTFDYDKPDNEKITHKFEVVE